MISPFKVVLPPAPLGEDLGRRNILTLALVSILAAGCTNLQVASEKASAEPTNKVVLKPEVKWRHLNPKRGDKAPKAGTLCGNPKDGHMNGSLVNLPAGFTGKIRSHASIFGAVVIKGQPQYQMPGATDVKTLEPGSYFGSAGESVHQISSKAGEQSIIYVRTDGKYDVTGGRE